MTIRTDLDQQLEEQRLARIANVNSFLSGAATRGLTQFLEEKTTAGKTSALVHIETGSDVWYLDKGYATLSGELAMDASNPAQGITQRNGNAIIYLSQPELSIEDFQTVVMDFVSNLVTEGMGVTVHFGTDMADLYVLWG